MEFSTPTAIQDLLHGEHLDHEDEVAAAAALMVNENNETTPESTSTPNNATPRDVFSGWTHSGICQQRSAIQMNTTLNVGP